MTCARCGGYNGGCLPLCTDCRRAQQGLPPRKRLCPCGAILFGRARLCRTCGVARQLAAKRAYEAEKRQRHRACPECGTPMRKESVRCERCCWNEYAKNITEAEMAELDALEPVRLHPVAAERIIEEWGRG